MKPIDEIMRARADSLDMSRGDQLSAIQEVLDGLFPGKVRARRLKSAVLTIETPSAVVASDLRLQREDILERLHEYEIVSLKISIR